MNAMNAPVCDTCEAPKMSIKDRMLKTHESLLGTLAAMLGVRR